MMFGGKTEEEPSMDIIDRYLDAGHNFLDTANVYVHGRSEEVVGKALKRNGKRNYVVLATKVHGPMRDDDPNRMGNHRRMIIEQCDASLKRLQTDWIDLYQIHRPMSSIPIDETLRALDDLIRAGKVRYIGTSTFAAWQVVESLWASKELGLNRFICEQPPYHLLDRRIERELLPMAQTYGVGIIPWSPLAGGFLTGKYKRGETAPEDARWSEDRGGKHFQDRAFDVIEALETMASEKNAKPDQLALAWVKDRPGVTSPIIGPRTMEQFDDNMGAVNVSLSENDVKKLDELSPPGEFIVPYYNADFGPHVHRW
jgi:aryl-alcohol dehydrogenase-like predicted oxidoreductase